MAKIYVLYKQTESMGGYVTKMGGYMNYNVGFIPGEYYDNRIEISKNNVTVLDEDLAKAWKFADSYSGTISVKFGTSINDDLQLLSSSEDNKVQYTLTDEDVALGILFNKTVMKKIIEDRFNEKLRELQLDASELERATWEVQRREASAYQADNSVSCSVLSTLALARSGSSGGMSSGSYFSGSLTVSQLATKVISKSDAYFTKLTGLLKEQQILGDIVDSCKTIADCHRVKHERFGVSMTALQQTEESISSSPATTKITF